MYNEIFHPTMESWLNAFDLACQDYHTTISKDDSQDRTLGWLDVTLGEWHKIGLIIAVWVRKNEPHIAHSVVPWIGTRAGRETYFGGKRVHLKRTKVRKELSPPTDPDIWDGWKWLLDCGGSMAQENNPVAKELIAGGWAEPGPLDKFGRQTLRVV